MGKYAKHLLRCFRWWGRRLWYGPAMHQQSRDKWSMKVFPVPRSVHPPSIPPLWRFWLTLNETTVLSPGNGWGEADISCLRKGRVSGVRKCERDALSARNNAGTWHTSAVQLTSIDGAVCDWYKNFQPCGSYLVLCLWNRYIILVSHPLTLNWPRIHGCL